MDHSYSPEEVNFLIENLNQYISSQRMDLIHAIVQNRTRHLTVVLEDIFQSHNASAVIRSCECFGVQDVHIIENHNHYEKHRTIDMGSSRWIDIHRHHENGHNNTHTCLKSLKDKGYQIIATSLDESSIPIEEVDIHKKTALLFGTEETGLSDIALELADQKVKLPMFGFTQSFNISVCAALCLYSLSDRMRKSDIDWNLNSQAQKDLILSWMINSIKAGKKLVKYHLEKFHE